MSIQYKAPGFEPTTFQIWVVTHYHKTMAPARIFVVILYSHHLDRTMAIIRI